jgi:hypothetical protein
MGESKTMFCRFMAALLSSTVMSLASAGASGPYSPATAQSGLGSFDYYISPTGSDSNNGLTPAAPWAITALNTKRLQYAGTRVGLMDGTYDLSAMNAYDGGTGGTPSPVLQIAAGTAGDPTFVGAVNCRQAIFQMRAGGGTGARSDIVAIGQGPGGGEYGHVVLDCLNITGAAGWFCVFWGEGNLDRDDWSEGVTIQNSYFHDSVLASQDNNPACWLDTQLNPTFRNNRCEDIGDTSNGYGPTCVMTLSVRGLVMEYNTAINTRTLLHDKHNDAPGPANDGFVIRCNRAEDLNHPAIIGLDTEYEAQSPDDDYQASEVYGNLFVDTNGIWAIKISSPTRMDVTLHHNTLAMESNVDGVVISASDTTSDLVSFHSNIVDTGGFSTGEYDYVVVSTGAFGTLNYNAYSPGSFAAYIASPVGSFDGSTTFTASNSLPAWRLATGQEANSIQADCALDSDFRPTNAACIATGQSGTNMGHTGSSCTRAGADWSVDSSPGSLIFANGYE